ncbi:hypothetical protein Nepgr_012899 [Nepenthes gracilis]|uniref:Uncharacterized protein n=1 Tax=Nepenthes gracilis TaxID=150966 RepID=A0AAD3SGX4_NEPGR|nr:hypothetical protein Nepgr_012899 [Nepenthes gracilis]
MNEKAPRKKFAELSPPYLCRNGGSGVIARKISASNSSSNAFQEVEKSYAAYSSEICFRFCDETVIYHGDIEEFQTPTKESIDCQDQRVFVFKPSAKHREAKSKHDEGYEETTGPRRPRSGSKQAKKRVRMRSMPQEKRMNTVGWEMYSFAYQNRIHTQENQPFHRELQGKKLHSCIDRGRNLQACECTYFHFNSSSSCDCEMKKQCYFCTNNDEDYKNPVLKRKRGIVNLADCHVLRQDKSGDDLCICIQEEEKLIELDYIPLSQKSLSISKVRAMTNGASCFQDHSAKDQTMVIDELNNMASSMDGDLVGGAMLPPYSRATISPRGRCGESRSTGAARSNSLPNEALDKVNGKLPPCSPGHVHPKLPDYEELVATFMALKKVHQQKRDIPMMYFRDELLGFTLQSIS